jgi:hypothetical protein
MHRLLDCVVAQHAARGGGEVARRASAMQREALEAGEVHLRVARRGVDQK